MTENRRSGGDRRSGEDRRKRQRPFDGSEKRRVVQPKPMNPQGTPRKQDTGDQRRYYTTQEVADRLGLSQTTLTLWIRNKMIDDSKIRRDGMGHRLWTDDDIRQVMKVKKQEGWA